MYIILVTYLNVCVLSMIPLWFILSSNSCPFLDIKLQNCLYLMIYFKINHFSILAVSIRQLFPGSLLYCILPSRYRQTKRGMIFYLF